MIPKLTVLFRRCGCGCEAILPRDEGRLGTVLLILPSRFLPAFLFLKRLKLDGDDLGFFPNFSNFYIFAVLLQKL